MKNIKHKIVVLVALAFMVTTGTNAQVGKDIKSAKDKVEKQKEAVKEQANSKKEEAKEAVKETAAAKENDAKGVNKLAREKAKAVLNDKSLSIEEKEKALYAMYENRLKAAKTDEEKARIKKSFDKMLYKLKNENSSEVAVQKDLEKDVKDKSEAVKKDAKEKATAATKAKKKDLPTQEIKGTLAKVDKRDENYNKKLQMISKSKTRIEAAKARLATAKKEGKLSAEELEAKGNRIAKAEAILAKLEGSLKKGKEVNARQKQAIGKLSKE